MNFEKLKNGKIVVTGGAGFIGSNLIKRLLGLGCTNIISLDDYSAGSVLNHHSGVNYHTGSTKNIKDIVSFPADFIFHFGEYSRVESSFMQLNKTIQSNLLGTASVINYWLESNAKLIYSGSSTKYILGEGQNETSPYSITKRKNAEIINSLGTLLQKNYATVYFYNVYGLNENCSEQYGTVISKFLKFKKERLPLPVVKPGTQIRNFTHIDDTIEGILLAAEHGHGDDYGIGAEQAFSILEVAKLFDADIEFIPERLGNRVSAELKTEKIKKLGWKQKHTLNKYIEIEIGKLQSAPKNYK